MTLALVLGKLSPDAMKGFLTEGPAARERYCPSFVGQAGVTVHGYYLAEGVNGIS